MTLSVILLVKGLIAAIIVGFVTASIKSWIDRVFLVIMLVGILGLPIQQAIIVNLGVVGLASLLMILRERKFLHPAGPIGKYEWVLIAIPAVLGGLAGRLAASVITPKILLAVLGVYAVGVGLRILLIKPLGERETKAHPAWLMPIALVSGLFEGLISAGAKPFAVPAYNNAMGHHPKQAYAFATLGVVSATWTALATQFAVVSVPSVSELILSLYEFLIITAVALLVDRFWNPKLQKVVNYTIAPILIIVGIRFFVMAIR